MTKKSKHGVDMTPSIRENDDNIRSLRLTDETWKQLQAGRDENDLDWEAYIKFLLRGERGQDLMLAQLDAQAQRIGRTRGQVIRMLAGVLGMEELNFVRLDRETYDRLRVLSDEAGKTCSEWIIDVICEAG